MHMPGLVDVLALAAIVAVIISLWRGMRALEQIAESFRHLVKKTDDRTPPQG
jgi:hypothetical protein